MKAPLLLVVCCCLFSCSSLAPHQLFEPRPLLAPKLLGQRLHSQQTISFNQAEQRKQLLAEITISAETLQLFALDGFATPLFEISFDGENLTQHSFVPQLSDDFPLYIVADIQLVYWPLDAIEYAYQERGFAVIDAECEGYVRCRTLFWQQRVISVVRYAADNPWQGRVELDNLIANYHLQIDTLSYEPL